MPQVVSFLEAASKEIVLAGRRRLNLIDTADVSDLPYAFLMRQEPGRVVGTHFHPSDQWQFIIDGKGTLGQDNIERYSLHFSRAYTPYGPLASDRDIGLSNLVLYPHFPCADVKFGKYLPQDRDTLNSIKDRHPFQIKGQMRFPSQDGRTISGLVELEEVSGLKDEHGMAALTLTMKAHAETVAPDPSNGGGQYVIVIKGSLWHENKEYKALSLVFVGPDEAPFRVLAGAEGLEAAVLSFPRHGAVAGKTDGAAKSVNSGKWECELCGFTYEEINGLPEDGIPAGTRWEDVPEDWTCPDCAVSKNDFRMVEI